MILYLQHLFFRYLNINLFTVVANTTSSKPSYRVREWGQAGSHKVAEKDYVFTKTSQVAFIGVISLERLRIHQPMGATLKHCLSSI